MLKMNLNTNYIDVFKYFCKYFLNTIFKISSLFIRFIINLKMSEILDIKLVQLYNMSMNHIAAETDSHFCFQ